MKTGYIKHPAYLLHDTGPGHPESPKRLSVLDQKIFVPNRISHQSSLIDRLEIITPTLCPDLYEWISEIHKPAYIKTLKKKIGAGGRVYLDPDTPCVPESLGAAEMAVSGLLTAIDAVMSKEINNAFCAIRPPGHHAEPDRAMGFCLFNSVAVGARYIQKKYKLEKVLIIDWDVHHGNGTQHAFYDDPSVFYFSTHQFPCYPGTGASQERGIKSGEGFTFNAPLSAGSGDSDVLRIFEKELADITALFKPDFILISAGFDAHRDDPLASLEVTSDGFAEMTQIVYALAKQYCQSRIVSSLEGGYNLEALARSVKKHLEVLSQESPDLRAS